jgi:hypothetical protein
MWGHSKTVWAVLVGALMLLGSFAAVVGNLPEPRANAPEEPKLNDAVWGGTSERVVIVEKFTADWCQFCPSQAFALNRLHDELGLDNLIVLEHHPSTSDQIYYAPSRTRMLWYGVSGYPTSVFGGGGYYFGDALGPGQAGAKLWQSGGTTKWDRYFNDRDSYQLEKDRTTNLTISLTGDITSTGGRFTAHLEATDPIQESDLVVRFMVYESNIHLPLAPGGENYQHHRVYNHVVRAILTDYPIADGSFDQGDTLDVERTFTIDAGWDIRTLGVAAFLQTDNRIGYLYGSPVPNRQRYNAPILQGAAMDFVPTGVLLVDGNDNDNYAYDFDHYDEILTLGDIPHHNWDTFETKALDSLTDNYRTMPSFGDLDGYSAVIWFESYDTNTLSTASRTAIQSYLDDRGNLLITGEDIAYDANTGGWTSWLENFLQATYLNDNGIGSQVDGIPMDPITGPFMNVGITHSSPDVIGTFGSTEIFVFTSNPMDVAGIRADYDGDSRVIYDAFDYFEATDIWDGNPEEEDLMRRMLDWLDWGAPPTVDVLQPDGGEVIDKLTSYRIQWLGLDVEMPETPVSIEYTTDSGSPVWIPISTNEPNDGVYIWTTPDVDSDKCRVRICAVDMVGQSNCALSDADFTIGVPPDTSPPEINNVLLDGLPSRTVNPGVMVELTATINDINTGLSDIDGANYSIDLVWNDADVMFPTDGAFDSGLEDVNVTIDTTGWPDASYQICVHGWDFVPNHNITFDGCATLIISSAAPDTTPPEITNILIDGLPVGLYDFSSKPASFTLGATVDDTTTGGSTIANASYVIIPPGMPSSPMLAVDFIFNEVIEDVIASAGMPNWPGSYQICIYASDSSANVNVTGGCADLTITDDLAPQVLNVLVNNSKTTTTLIGTPVYLNATISDANTGNSDIILANYTDGVTNWITSTDMLADDGLYNSPVEDVTTLIDTSGWSIGMHTICVYAEDSWSNYNLSSADCVQLDVLAFGPLPPIMLDAQLSGVGMGDVVVTWQASGDDGVGLDNVVEYEVYSSNLYGGLYNLDTTIPAIDQATYQHTCVGCGYGDPDDYFFYVRAYNGMEYSPSPNRAGKFVRHLTTGTQLFSVPLVLSDNSLGAVLQTIQFDKIWTFDASDMTDHWKSYDVMKPYKGDLSTIDHTKAYWINVLVEDDLVVAGLVPVLTQIQLRAGWNLVSFPSLNPLYTVGQLKLDIMAMAVEGFDPAVPYCLTPLLDFNMVTAGEGFWIYVTTDRVWDVIQ